MKRLVFTILLSLLLLDVFSCRSYTSDFDLDALLAPYAGSIQVSNDNPYIVVRPENAVAGLIFYPGGLVEYQSYLPLMIKCAQKGIACFIVQMPSDFAIMDMNAALRVLERYGDIASWYIGGHSLGGAMAASFAAAHTDRFEGLVLMAAYSTENLKGSGLRVLSVYGSRDGVLNMKNYEKYRKNLTDDAVELVIEGGNHGQFGNYGFQAGDNEALVSADVQQELTAEAVGKLCVGQ